MHLAKPGWWPGLVPFSPALIILPFPGLFRFTCYYYRGAYYKAFWADPPSCTVGEPRSTYWGEHSFPLVLQNFHRYAFYAALVFIVLLWKDTIEAFFFPGADGRHFGIGLGSLVFLVNIVLLSLYTFSCHSWRHLIGGSVDCYSCSILNKSKHGLWQKVSFINETHGRWAMWSLVSVALVDVYVYLVAAGHIADIKFF